MDPYVELLMGMKNTKVDSLIHALDEYIEAKINNMIHRDWEQKQDLENDVDIKRELLSEQLSSLIEELKVEPLPIDNV